MSAKSDSRLAEFLRRVLAGDNDAAPAEIVFGQQESTEIQQSMALQFAESIREMGYIEPVGGADGDLRRVQVTTQGAQWLDDYDQNKPALHPRYSS